MKRWHKITTKLHWIPVILTGIFVLWFGFRSMVLRHAIEGKFEAWGMNATCGTIQWQGLFQAKIQTIEAGLQKGGHLELRQIDLSLSPNLSFHGKDWVESLAVAVFRLEKDGFFTSGSGEWRNGSGKLAGHSRFQHIGSCNWEATLSQEKQAHRPSKLLDFQLEDIVFDHPKIGKEAKKLQPIAGQLRFQKSPNDLLKIEKGSFIQSEKAILEIEGEFARDQNALKLALNIPKQSIQDWLDPISALADSSLKNLQVKGEFEAEYAISVYLDSLESLQINAKTKGYALEIIDYGDSKLDSLQIAIAAKSNRLQALPALLQRAVVISEDANFWEHKGFDLGIFTQAIVENIQKRQFVRGAGTIPMQLVRNHCLHQTKQLDRKLSEIVLTWLLEHVDPPSKKQELALYLDTIEWGPNIYGIDAAAHFYFKRSPAQLQLDQIIFLCMIIPNPKQYQKVFDENGALDGFALEYFESMRWILYEMDLIDEAQLDEVIQLDLKVGRWKHLKNELV